MLVLVTFLAFATMVGLLWLSPKSSFTQLGDSTVYGGVAFVALLIAYAALMLRKAHQYTGRLVLIGAVGLAVMLVGWALRSS